MNFITKLQPVIILLAALSGLLIGATTSFGNYSINFVQPFLMLLLLIVFLTVDLKTIKEAFSNYKFTIASLLVNFIWTPIFAIILGTVFLSDSVDMQVGFLMLMVTPCTDWYLIFTDLAKGNVALATSVLPLNLIIQVVLLPIYLILFFGNNIRIVGTEILSSIFFVLVVPLILAQVLNIFMTKKVQVKSVIDKMLNNSDTLQLLFLCLAIVSMFSSESNEIMDNPFLLLQMLLPIASFFIVNFLLVNFIAKKLHFTFYDTVPLIMTTLARNSPLSLAIAVSAFPERPIIALVLVLGPLIELPVLRIVSILLNRMKRVQIK